MAMGTVAGLAVDDLGASDARAPLVLLHGLSFDHSMWRPALEQLGRLDPGRRVLAFDLPGHGSSPPSPPYDIESLVQRVHSAVEEAGLDRPVVVGHSLAGIVATVYGATHPTRGVVNVDQPLQVAPFAGFLRSIAEQLRGPGFPELWGHFLASMHIELLPPSAQELVRSTSTPRQELVLGYWQEVLEGSPDELAARTAEGLASLRAAHVPYLVVAGDALEDGYRRWLETELPQASITVLSGSGHFPHLAHPDRFAEILAGTGAGDAA
jgi:pimeloyl-ACP methyl ester carboxylesterase